MPKGFQGFQKGNVPTAGNRKGCNLSQDHKDKIAAAGRERRLSEQTRRKIGDAHRGKVLTPETRAKMSASAKARIERDGPLKYWQGRHNPSIAGDKSHYWRGGKSFEKYAPEFTESLKEAIRTRDRRRCQKCFKHEQSLRTKTGKPYRLAIHHIDYNKKNCAESNLVSLCRPCHNLTNHYDRANWTRYFSAGIGDLSLPIHPLRIPEALLP